MFTRVVVGILMACCLTVLSYGRAAAVLGIPDNVPAATVLVPLLEAQFAGAPNTLLVITNICNANITLHWQIWNVEGTAVNLAGNVALDPYEPWVADFKGTAEGGSTAAKSQLTDDTFYRGFLTADVVTSATNLLPTEEAYPFGSSNCLKGTIYYVRLTEGAANGIPAVHIEGGLDEGLDSFIRGFYRSDDDREEFDNHARYYAERRTRALPFVNDPDLLLDAIISRVFLDPSLNGKTRIVVWAWGVPDYGTGDPGDGGRGPFTAQHRDEKGATVATSFLEL